VCVSVMCDAGASVVCVWRGGDCKRIGGCIWCLRGKCGVEVIWLKMCSHTFRMPCLVFVFSAVEVVWGARLVRYCPSLHAPSLSSMLKSTSYSYFIFLPTFEEDLAPQAICFVQLLGGRE